MQTTNKKKAVPAGRLTPERPLVKKGLKHRWEMFSNMITKATGTPAAFFIALIIVIVWAATGPMFNYSQVWQLVINTGTTIITFLMIFVIQQSQNKDTMAIHLKLNEIIAANEFTSNRLIDSEDLTEEELKVIKKYYERLSQRSSRENSLFVSHSVDEAEENQKRKGRAHQQPPRKKTQKP